MNYHKKNYTNRKNSLTLLLMAISFACCNAKNQQPSQANNTIQQEIELQSVDSSPKLNAERIFCSVKDKSGNLWFGTYQKGLYKYDGNLFTHIAINDEPKENIIRSLFADRDGNIWVGTEDKIWKYDGKLFTNILIPEFITSSCLKRSKNNLTPLPWVMTFMQDRIGRIWIGTGNGVYVYNGFNSFSLTRFLDNKNIINKDSIQLRAVQTILEDKKGNIWFGSGGDGIGEDGICRFDGKTLISFKPKGYGRCMASLEDFNGDLYFSSGYNIFKYDGKTFVNIAEKEGIKFWSGFIYKDKNGNLWLWADNGGLYIYDKHTFTKLNAPDVIFGSVVEDNYGNLWFGTAGQGLYRFDGKEFKSYSK